MPWVRGSTYDRHYQVRRHGGSGIHHTGYGPIQKCKALPVYFYCNCGSTKLSKSKAKKVNIATNPKDLTEASPMSLVMMVFIIAVFSCLFGVVGYITFSGAPTSPVFPLPVEIFIAAIGLIGLAIAIYNVIANLINPNRGVPPPVQKDELKPLSKGYFYCVDCGETLKIDIGKPLFDENPLGYTEDYLKEKGALRRVFCDAPKVPHLKWLD